MADDNKQPANNFPSNVVVVALLLVTGTAVYFQPAPLQGARPPVTGTAIRQNGAKENIDARLWQDPFGAIAKWHREQLAKDKSDKSEGKTPHCADGQCDSPLSRAPTGDDETLALAVTVSGSPYAESEEGRRRARYAVVSALRITGFMPASAEHIRYWRPVDCQPADKQQRGPLKMRMENAPPGTTSGPIAPFRTNGSTARTYLIAACFFYGSMKTTSGTSPSTCFPGSSRDYAGRTPKSK